MCYPIMASVTVVPVILRDYDVAWTLAGVQTASKKPASSVKAPPARTRLRRLRKQQTAMTPGQPAEGAMRDAEQRRRARE